MGVSHGNSAGPNSHFGNNAAVDKQKFPVKSSVVLYLVHVNFNINHYDF